MIVYRDGLYKIYVADYGDILDVELSKCFVKVFIHLGNCICSDTFNYNKEIIVENLKIFNYDFDFFFLRCSSSYDTHLEVVKKLADFIYNEFVNNNFFGDYSVHITDKKCLRGLNVSVKRCFNFKRISELLC